MERRKRESERKNSVLTHFAGEICDFLWHTKNMFKKRVCEQEYASKLYFNEITSILLPLIIFTCTRLRKECKRYVHLCQYGRVNSISSDIFQFVIILLIPFQNLSSFKNFFCVIYERA